MLTLAPSPDFLSSEPSAALAEIEDRRDSLQGTHIIHESGIATQLLLLPGSTANRSLAALIPLDSQTLGRVEALVRFWRAHQGRPVPPDTRVTVQQKRRLRLMMRASDGRANGASYREIATAFYGTGRVVSAPWKTSSLRDAVIGLAKGGKAMIAGGYLQLLRHRKRP
ncbi:DUF2285 domain-containing protein [Mesorhizobium sp. M1E.F.Ca.ET.063.01.1.1]|uniref:DUF2285 domain-containing protein n=1 Tax=Mesorhizobium sp. M1E.F.Ca.ET.063.01.1.1 TaxID=2496750 RepID=UPI000FC99E99|nr:DUF2285 domain-containing protein [Mesorhizobium sp. M1E.F.Ca.ET.063.01.1.1]RUW85908.1 DUF2285 domain-containing protein [Mesorhizobium sp. M1E.F.Ca.ET.063.01.1.1]